MQSLNEENELLKPGSYRILGATRFGGCFENSRFGYTAKYADGADVVGLYSKDGTHDRNVTLRAFLSRFLFEKIYP